MTKLHEIIAVEPDLKNKAAGIVAEAIQLFQNGTIRFVGQTRKYSPNTEDGEKLPDEITELGTTVGNELKVVRKAFGEWIDAAVTKETGNADTSADVEVGGKAILSGLSAPALLNLEGKLGTLRALYAAIPVNDPTELWTFDTAQGIWVSQPRETQRTKKIPRALIGAPATDKQPANVQYYTEDVKEGTWTTVKRSGSLSVTEKRELIERVDVLLRAVKSARQRANDVEIGQSKVAGVIFDFIHGK